MSALNELKQHKFALSFIGLLVFVRFVVYPIMDWQEQLHSENQLLDRKITRVEQLLASQNDLRGNLSELNSHTSKSQTWFFDPQEDSAFQLARQRWLEGLLKKHSLRTVNTGWRLTQEMEQMNAKRYVLQVNFNGATKDVIGFMQEVYSQPQFIEVTEFSLNLRRQHQARLGEGGMNLVLSFYTKDSVS